jgi:hypothetical protein
MRAKGKVLANRHGAALLLALALLIGAGGTAIGQSRWAAVDPNSDATSPVAWGATASEARRRASEACKRLSHTCANGPAATDAMGDVFAIVCCRQPRVGCAAAAAASKREALRAVERMFDKAGYSQCGLRHYMSAANGERR